MVAKLRAIPNALWWVTVFFAVLALFTQLAISVARSAAISWTQLLLEFALTTALLCIPVALAWVGKQRQSLWYALAALIVLIAFARVFFA